MLVYNPRPHKMELQPILHVWIHTDNDLVDLTITTATHAPHSTTATKTSETIHTNQKHPFFTEEKGFVPVGQLKLGMHVLRADGRIGVITGWKIVPGVKVMYNLEVAQDHTFTVGTGEWVVHNCGGFDDAIKTAMQSGNKGQELEGQVGNLLKDRLIGFQQKIMGAGGKIAGEIDAETPEAIIEVTTKADGKFGQIQKLMSNPIINPEGKPVILYAPNYTTGAAKAIEGIGGYVVRSPQGLFDLLDTL